MEKNSFSYKTLRNFVYSFVNFLLPMFFTIFVTRTSAIKLGASEFGVLLLVNAISSFINYVDLGLGTAVTKFAAEYRGSKNDTGLENLLNSSRLLFFCTGFLGLLVFFILGKWFLPSFNIASGSYSHIFWVFFLAGVVFLFNSLSSIYGSALTALQRFDILSNFGLVSLIVSSLGTILILESDYRLKAVMAFNAVLSFFTLVFYHYFVRKLLPELRFSFKFNWLEIKKAYGFGILTFISNLASSTLIYLDRLIIPIFLGPSQLPFYGVPGNIALKTSVVTNTFGQMFLPMASEFSGAGALDKLQVVYVRAFRNLHIISAAVTVSIVLFAHKILFFWLGQEYADKSSSVLIILAFTYFIVALYIPLQGLLLGLGKLKFLIKQSLFMAALNLILLLILVPRYGILGAAWSYLLAVLPMGFAFYWTEKYLFNMAGQFKSYLFLYSKLIITALVSSIIIYYLLLGLVNSVLTLVIIGPLSVLLYLAIYFLFGFFDEQDIAIIKSFAVKFLRLEHS